MSTNDESPLHEQPHAEAEPAKEKTQEYPPPLDAQHEAADTAPTRSTSSPAAPKQTWLEQPVPQPPKAKESLPVVPQSPQSPKVQKSSQKPASVSTSILAEPANYDKPLATTPLHAIPGQELGQVAGEGRLEAPIRPSETPIHWIKLPEHFPVSSTIPIPSGTPKAIPRIQHKFTAETENEKIARKQRLKAISDAAARAWKGYRDNAWMHDEVRPVTGGVRDPFCGWAATLVDGLDTLWIMGMKEEFEEAVRAVGKIDFTTSTRKDIPLFETTIRYLGGLVAAYDISNGKYVTLLDKAVELAEILMGAFDTPNRMPVTYYHWMPTFASQPHRASTRVVMAEIGSLSMEFTRLAQLTKEPKYYDAIDRVTDAFYEWQNRQGNGTLLPGLFPTYLDASGCEKPAQIMGTSKAPAALSDDVDKLASLPVKAEKPASEAPLSDVAKEDKMSPAHGQPGKGKIVGWDNPITEGSLDTKAAKEDVLQKTGSDLNLAPAAAKPVGKLGKVAGWDGDVDEAKLASKNAELLQKSAQDTTPQADKPFGKVGKIAGWEEPIEEGSLDSTAAKKELYDEIHRTDNTKHKRQLGGELAETNLPPATGGHRQAKATDDNPQQQTKFNRPAVSDTEICIPRGLVSSSRAGTDTFTLGGMADSTYEYLPKEYLLLGGLEPKYRTMYEKSMDAVIDKLLYRPMTPDEQDVLFAGEYMAYRDAEPDGKTGTLKPEAAHLTCFAGAMFALGAKIFDREEDLDIGAKLTEGCVWAYNVTATGIMPEMALLAPCDNMHICPWNQTQYWDLLDPHRASRTMVPDLPPRPSATVGKEEEQVQSDTAPKQRLPPQKLPDNSVLTKRQAGASPGQLYPNLPKLDDLKPHVNVPTKTTLGDNTHSSELHKPVSHEEFVQTRIKDERLPPGFTKINSKKYILRYVLHLSLSLQRTQTNRVIVTDRKQSKVSFTCTE